MAGIASNLCFWDLSITVWNIETKGVGLPCVTQFLCITKSEEICIIKNCDRLEIHSNLGVALET